MNWILQGFYQAALMGWETGWALVLGFGISAALQTFVSKDRMGRLFGRVDLRSMTLATGFGAASSSCSYAAAAAARSAFTQGAALIPALAFMFASTNLVIELGAVLWLLMGWRFVLAEVLGAFVLIGLLWIFSRLIFPRDLETIAREHAETKDDQTDCCHHQSTSEHANHDQEHHEASDERGNEWQRMGSAFTADWQMLWKEIAVGFLVAGFLSVLVPEGWWKAMFLSGGPAWLRLIENAVVGPLIAVASFVCSIGNLPLASLLWSDGISFGGVISFIYADLLILPLVFVYRKYYGPRATAYITAVLFVSMVGAGIIVDMIFSFWGWVPTGPRPPNAMQYMAFQWNYTAYLDIVSLPIALGLWWLGRPRNSIVPRNPGSEYGAVHRH